MSVFKTMILGVSLAALTACGSKEKVSSDALITTPQGPVQGVNTEDSNIYNFKGLPFAAPPIGNLRWTAPEPAPKWNETLVADTFGNRCMQPSDVEGGFFTRLIERAAFSPGLLKGMGWGRLRIFSLPVRLRHKNLHR